MKIKKKMKKISHLYKKRGSRILSDHSLSQLLQIASYKKRINDLTRNNRLLTNALQESLVEAASQSNLIKDYARDINQILFARLKLNDMAKNLAKFATDLEEVQSYLNISLPSEYNFFQKKKPSNERIMKIPDVSSIAEEPELSQNETLACESSPDDVFLSTSEENVAPVNHDIEMTPVLFVNDSQESKKKKRSRSIDKESLTPQLNIDCTFVNQRRSTRSRGKTSSFGKKSSGRVASRRNATSSPLADKVQDPVELNKVVLKSPLDTKNSKRESKNTKIPVVDQSDESVVIGNDDCSIFQSTDLIKNNDKSVVSNIDLSQVAEINEEVCPLEPEIAKNTSSNDSDLKDNSKILSDIDEKNVNSINDNICIENDLQNSINISQNTSSILIDTQLPEVLKFDKEIQNVGSLTFCDSDEDADDHGNEKKNTNSPQKRSSRMKKLVKYSDFFLSDESDTESSSKLTVNKKRKSGKGRIKLNSIPNGGSIEKSDCENTEEISSESSLSHMKKSVKYSDFFLSDESDTESPFKLAVNKKRKSGKGRIKLNSTPNGRSIEKSDCENTEEISSGVVKEVAEANFSVYDLDVSNSKNKKKTYRRKPSSQKSKNTKENDMPKPLYQKYSVSKFKPGKLKFSKFEVTLKKKSITALFENSRPNACVSPGGILKKPRPSIVINENKGNEIVLNETKSTDTISDTYQQNMFQTPKRVSFAPTDLVCKFEKMSESKAVANNRKVRRTSKSAIDFRDLFGKEDSPETNLTSVDNLSNKTGVQKFDNSIMFDFSAETEVYTFQFPPNAQFPVIPAEDTLSKVCANKSPIQTKLGNDDDDKSFTIQSQFPVLPADEIRSLVTSASLISEQVNLSKTETDKNLEKSPKTSMQCSISPSHDHASSNLSSIISKENSSGNINKLSVKENDVSNDALSQLNIARNGTLNDILLLESPVSLVKRPKRKSLFKESPDNDLKENINSNYPAPEQKESLKSIIFTNKNSSITPLADKKKASRSKSQTKVSKISAGKSKKSNPVIKSLENSPLLTDATNLIADENHPRRRSKQVSYKEPTLKKKLRRE